MDVLFLVVLSQSVVVESEETDRTISSRDQKTKAVVDEGKVVHVRLTL